MRREDGGAFNTLFSALFGAVFIISSINGKNIFGVIFGALFLGVEAWRAVESYIASARARKWDSELKNDSDGPPASDARDDPEETVETGRRCPSCGAFVREDFVYCPYCGRKFKR